MLQTSNSNYFRAVLSQLSPGEHGLVQPIGFHTTASPGYVQSSTKNGSILPQAEKPKVSVQKQRKESKSKSNLLNLQQSLKQKPDNATATAGVVGLSLNMGQLVVPLLSQSDPAAKPVSRYIDPYDQGRPILGLARAGMLSDEVVASSTGKLQKSNSHTLAGAAQSNWRPLLLAERLKQRGKQPKPVHSPVHVSPGALHVRTQVVSDSPCMSPGAVLEGSHAGSHGDEQEQTIWLSPVGRNEERRFAEAPGSCHVGSRPPLSEDIQEPPRKKAKFTVAGVSASVLGSPRVTAQKEPLSSHKVNEVAAILQPTPPPPKSTPPVSAPISGKSKPVANGNVLPQRLCEVVGAARASGVSRPGDLLKLEVLKGEEIEYRKVQGVTVIRGKVGGGGGILCDCDNCCGRVELVMSKFEEHASSQMRRPAEHIYLSTFDMSLKSLAALVLSDTPIDDPTPGPCAYCGNREGQLLKCCYCTTAVHTGCVGLQEMPQGAWVCEACESNRETSALPIPLGTPEGQEGWQADMETMDRGIRARNSRRTPPASSTKVHRIQMACPTRARGGSHRAAPKHRYLFMGGEDALKEGEAVVYRDGRHGKALNSGHVVTDPDGNGGIFCDHCQKVVSCSTFEAHSGRGARRRPYDNIYVSDGRSLKEVAEATEVSLEDLTFPSAKKSGKRSEKKMLSSSRGETPVADGVIMVDQAGGCVVCKGRDFQTGQIVGPRTIFLCDQCEREFHAGCLRDITMCEDLQDGKEIDPDNPWFCTPGCHRVYQGLKARVQEGEQPCQHQREITLQLFQGPDNTAATTRKLKELLEILHESFDPIVDVSSKEDMLPAMVKATTVGDWDYTGMYTCALRQKTKTVCVAVFRVFGEAFAEVPLVATRSAYRRQGHAQVLMRLLEDIFRGLGVQRVTLPAAHETVPIWVRGFGYRPLEKDWVELFRNETHVLAFPGTDVLVKDLLPASQQVPVIGFDRQSTPGAVAEALPVVGEPEQRSPENGLGLHNGFSTGPEQSQHDLKVRDKEGLHRCGLEEPLWEDAGEAAGGGGIVPLHTGLIPDEIGKGEGMNPKGASSLCEVPGPHVALTPHDQPGCRGPGQVGGAQISGDGVETMDACNNRGDHLEFIKEGSSGEGGAIQGLQSLLDHMVGDLSFGERDLLDLGELPPGDVVGEELWCRNGCQGGDQYWGPSTGQADMGVDAGLQLQGADGTPYPWDGTMEAIIQQESSHKAPDSWGFPAASDLLWDPEENLATIHGSPVTEPGSLFMDTAP